MDGRAKALRELLVDKLKVSKDQIKLGPGVQGENTNGNINIIQKEQKTDTKIPK